jgi:hypothetical protein
MNSSPFLLESIPSSTPPYQLRSEPDVFEVAGSLSPWMKIHAGSNALIFSNELLDFSGRKLHSTFSLHLQPRTDSIHDLRRLLNVVQSLFGLSGQGPFSISQRGESWFGYGLDSFLSAAEQQEGRYAELNWESYHHSEQLAYLDRPETGGLICVTSQQSTGASRGNLHSTFLEMYLHGVPVDSSRIRELCKIARNEDACLEFVKHYPVFECRLPERIEVRPLAKIVSNTDGKRFTSGLVVENPFRSSAVAVGDNKLEKLLALFRESEFLLCALRDWHGPMLMDSYHLTAIEACWIEQFCALYLLCDW